jgi:hypothetical protein
MQNIAFAFIFFASVSVFGQETLTLICQDSKNPEFQKYVYVDLINNRVLHENSFDNYVTDDLITYSLKISGNTHKTNIYRASGKYTVFVTGSLNFSFGGYCQKKMENKF